MASAKTKIILELEVNVLGSQSREKIVEQLDTKFGYWYDNIKSAFPGVTPKVILPPDWDIQ